MSAEHREQLEDAIDRVKNVHMLAVKQVQETHPDLSFVEQWAIAQRENPCAFKEESLDPPKVAQSAFNPPTSQVSVNAHFSLSSVLPKATSEPFLVEGDKCGLTTEIWGQPGGQVQRVDSLESAPDVAEPPEDYEEDTEDGEPVATFKKEYRDPDAQLVALLGALLLAGLVAKRALILDYVAENGPSRALGYAERILDSGWEPYFEKTAAILTGAATRAAHETIQGSKLLVGPELMRRAENHAVVIAKTEAASLLGLTYDASRDKASPNVMGATPGGPVIEALDQILETAKTEAWPVAQLSAAIESLGGFSESRAIAIAQDTLATVDGKAALGAAQTIGASQKRSESVRDGRVCPECVQNESQGWIAVDALFSGSLTADTPHHPRCRCSVEFKWNQEP